LREIKAWKPFKTQASALAFSMDISFPILISLKMNLSLWIASLPALALMKTAREVISASESTEQMQYKANICSTVPVTGISNNRKKTQSLMLKQ
jgi:hypothetical protein